MSMLDIVGWIIISNISLNELMQLQLRSLRAMFFSVGGNINDGKPTWVLIHLLIIDNGIINCMMIMFWDIQNAEQYLGFLHYHGFHTY